MSSNEWEGTYSFPQIIVRGWNWLEDALNGEQESGQCQCQKIQHKKVPMHKNRIGDGHCK